MPATIYLERPDKREMWKDRIVISLLLIILSFLLYLMVSDYLSVPNPNSFECMAGFEDSGCPAGYACTGMLVDCRENDAQFKYFFTDWFFDKPACREERIYSEICVENP